MKKIASRSKGKFAPNTLSEVENKTLHSKISYIQETGERTIYDVVTKSPLKLKVLLILNARCWLHSCKRQTPRHSKCEHTRISQTQYKNLYEKTENFHTERLKFDEIEFKIFKTFSVSYSSRRYYFNNVLWFIFAHYLPLYSTYRHYQHYDFRHAYMYNKISSFTSRGFNTLSKRYLTLY